MTPWQALLFLIIWVGCIILGRYVARQKNLSGVEGLVLGGLLGLIGVFIELLLPTKPADKT